MSGRRRSDRTLCLLAAIAAAAWFGSDALVRAHEPFWRAALAGGGRAATYPLQVEARLSLRQKPRTRMVALGSSVAQTDVGWRRVAHERGLAQGELVAIGVPGGQGFELAQLAPQLARLRPEQTLIFVTPWLLHEFVDWEGLRFYDPGTSFDLLGWRDSLVHHGVHASGLLNASHTVLRRREALRDQLFWDSRYAQPNRTVLARQARRERARPEEFSCSNRHIAALEAMIEAFSAIDSRVILIPAPLDDPRLPPEVTEQFGACLGVLQQRTAVERISVEQLPVMGPADFADYVHLNAAGRRRFTSALLALLPPLD